MTILYRLRDRNPADDGVCPIGGARDRSMRTLTRWVAVLALCPGCHLDASASIPVVCEHCITSHLCTTHLSGVTPRNDKHWCRRAALARRARGRYCASLGDNVPLSTALPLINKQMWGHMPLDRRANVPCDNTRPQPVNQVAMSCGALHPLRGATPVMWHYTRYVALHPIRSGAMPTDRVCRAGLVWFCGPGVVRVVGCYWWCCAHWRAYWLGESQPTALWGCSSL